MAFEFAVEECDVENKEALAQFRERREQWLLWMGGDEQHSLANQISGMLWNDATFRAINESRRLAADLDGKLLVKSGFLAEFIDGGWVAAQALAIRRLVEKEAKADDRQPISLPRLLSDIRRNRNLITRENYVCFDGLPYDYEPVRRKSMEEMMRHPDVGKRAFWADNKGPKAWGPSARAHAHFDRLSGMTAGKRRRDDTIPENVFERVSRTLAIKEVEQVGNFADKFIAHASDDASRSGLTEEDKYLTLARVSACHSAIIQCAKLIGGELLWDADRSFMPIAQFDPFAEFDAPWLPVAEVDALRHFWNDYVRAVEEIKPPELKA